MHSFYHTLFRAVVNPSLAFASSPSSSSPPASSVEQAKHSASNAPGTHSTSNTPTSSSNHYVAHSSAALSASACPVMHHQQESNSNSAEISALHQQYLQTHPHHQSSSVAHSAQNSFSGGTLAGGCPVPHHARHSAAASSPVSSPALAATVSGTASAPSASSSSLEDVQEPPDTLDNIIGGSHSSSSYLSARQDSDMLMDSSDNEGEQIPDSLIPASGRGNSEDGANWVNPSPNQLYRALKRKNKPIEKEDAHSVAAIHEWVTNGTWAEIVKSESSLYPKCPPKLIRFQGQDGNYSWKAWWISKVMGKSALPFDRHDWYIQRCEKEVKYIIDYYSYEIKAPGEKNNDTYTVYTIDARPAPTTRGMVDRARMAWSRWKKGEEWW